MSNLNIKLNFVFDFSRNRSYLGHKGDPERMLFLSDSAPAGQKTDMVQHLLRGMRGAKARLTGAEGVPT